MHPLLGDFFFTPPAAGPPVLLLLISTSAFWTRSAASAASGPASFRKFIHRLLLCHEKVSCCFCDRTSMFVLSSASTRNVSNRFAVQSTLIILTRATLYQLVLSHCPCSACLTLTVLRLTESSWSNGLSFVPHVLFRRWSLVPAFLWHQIFLETEVQLAGSSTDFSTSSAVASVLVASSPLVTWRHLDREGRRFLIHSFSCWHCWWHLAL